jgi:ATP-binding cassette subfamily B protein
MNEPSPDLVAFLSKIAPFDQLNQQELEKMARQLTPFRYRMGQIILMRDHFLHQIAIVYEGKVRLLGFDILNQQPISLGLVKLGGIIGWINLIRGVACETAIASEEVVCLTLTHQELIQFFQINPNFKSAFIDHISTLEIIDIFGYQLEKKAQTDLDLKQLAQEAMSQAKVYNLAPGKHQINETELINSEYLWLVSGGGTINDNFPNNRVNLPSGKNIIEVKGILPARFIGLPTAQWSDLLDNTNYHSNPELNGHQEAGIITIEHDNNNDNNNNHSTLVLGSETVEYAPIDQFKKAAPKAAKSSQQYPHFSGQTPLEAALACFQMLAKYFNIPLKKDLIQRILKEQFKQQETLSLSVCGAITELMGLKTQLIPIPKAAVSRLDAPILMKFQDSLIIVYDITDDQVVLGVPELGILERKLDTFLEKLEDRVEVLLISRTKETPEQKFGLSWFIPSVIRYRKVLIEVFLASFFVQLFSLANPLVIQQIIDKVIVQGVPDTLQVFGTLLLVLAVFEAILNTLRTYHFVDATNRIDMSLGSEIIDHLLRLPLSYFERRPVGEIATRVGELERIRQFLTGTALTVVLDAFFSVIYIIVMFIYSWKLTLVALGIIPLFVILTVIFAPIIRRQLRVKAERNAQTQSYLVEVMSGIQTVKAQNIELRSRWKWQENYARYVSTSFKTVMTSTLSSSGSNFLNQLSGLLVLWFGTALVLEGPPDGLTLGELIAFRIIAGYVTSPILRLTQLWQNFQETALSLERLADIVDHPQEAEQDRDNIAMPMIKGAVKYEDVCFRFKSVGPLQLNKVNLEFAPGTFVGVVGQSGAGKSTLTKLLSRLYEPGSGRILIDGYDINKVELYSLRRQIGVVPQEPLLFEGTVKENIALTNPDATDQEIIEAAIIANAHDFINNDLANGYNTNVGERGAALSGGQRQRIAIARSVLQKPKILVLDEATSALDYDTEKTVCENLKKTFHDITVFFITHRLSTIKNSDQIVLMDNGSVAEQGTHEQLMAKKGLYFALFNKQDL